MKHQFEKIKIRSDVDSREQLSPILLRRRLLSSIAVFVDFICIMFYTILSYFCEMDVL